MKELEYVPEACNGKGALFEGKVYLRAPLFKERYEAIESAGFELDEKGEVKVSKLKQLGLLVKLVELVRPFCLRVELRRKSDGAEFKTFEDLESDPGCDGILFELGSMFSRGFKPSKN